MKKNILYGFAGMLVLLSLTGCGEKKEENKKDNQKESETKVVENAIYTNSSTAIYLGDEIDLESGTLKSYTAYKKGELVDLEEANESTIDSSEFGKKSEDLLGKSKVYIKHILGDDNKVTSSYGCFKEEGKDEVCVIAYKASEYETNKKKLEEYFKGMEDTCFTEEGDIECDNDLINISNSEDVVYAYDYSTNLLCSVDFETGAFCKTSKID